MKKLILEVTRYIKRTGVIFNITVEHLCSKDEVQDIVDSEIKLWDLASTEEVEYYIRRVILLDYIEPTIEDVRKEIEKMKINMPKIKEQKCEDITDAILCNYSHYIAHCINVEDVMKKYGR